MKIYDYDRRFSLYTRYGNDEIIYKTKSYIIRKNYFTVLVLEKSIYQNRPFKVFYYSICTPYDSGFIQLDIITNSKYHLERKEYINDFRDELKEYINDFNEIYDDKYILSKLDIQILYRVINHFIHKNSKNSI